MAPLQDEAAVPARCLLCNCGTTTQLERMDESKRKGTPDCCLQAEKVLRILYLLLQYYQVESGCAATWINRSWGACTTPPKMGRRGCCWQRPEIAEHSQQKACPCSSTRVSGRQPFLASLAARDAYLDRRRRRCHAC